MGGNEALQGELRISLDPSEEDIICRARDVLGNKVPLGIKTSWAIESAVIRQAKQGLLIIEEGGRVRLNAKAWFRERVAKPKGRR